MRKLIKTHKKFVSIFPNIYLSSLWRLQPTPPLLPTSPPTLVCSNKRYFSHQEICCVRVASRFMRLLNEFTTIIKSKIHTLTHTHTEGDTKCICICSWQASNWKCVHKNGEIKAKARRDGRTVGKVEWHFEYCIWFYCHGRLPLLSDCGIPITNYLPTLSQSHSLSLSLSVCSWASCVEHNWKIAMRKSEMQSMHSRCAVSNPHSPLSLLSPLCLCHFCCNYRHFRNYCVTTI